MNKRTLIQIRVSIRNKLHDLRNLDYFVNTYRFDRAFELATEAEQSSIVTAVKSDNLLMLRTCCNQILKKDLEEKSLHELRIIASTKLIPNFNRYTKSGLIHLIKEIIKNEERRSGQKC